MSNSTSSDIFADALEQLRQAQREFVLGRTAGDVTEDEVLTIGDRSAGAREIRRIAEQFDVKTAHGFIANHMIRDGSRRGYEELKRLGTRTVRGFYRRELSRPGLWAIDPGAEWQFRGALFQLDGQDKDIRTPLHLLPIRQTLLTCQAYVHRKGQQIAADEKALRIALDIVDEVGDGIMADRAQLVYGRMLDRMGEGEDGAEDDETS